MNRFTGTGTLVRLILRRDRLRLPVWVVSLTGLMGWSALAVQGYYDTPATRASYAATAGLSAASIALSGPPVALDTLGGIAVFEVSQIAVVGTSLMAVFLTLRHTRGNEEAGRTELLRATALGRDADLAATLLVLTVTCAVIGGALALIMAVSGLPATGSALFGAAIAALGILFTTIALVAAQVTQHNRGAIGLCLVVLGVLYGLRAVGDVNDSWVTWSSPIGWVQGVHAFAEDRLWPLLPTLLLALVLAAFAVWLTTKRDLGRGLIADRLGPPAASAHLRGSFTLATRLQRSALASWVVGLAALGAVYGSFGKEVQGMVEDNPDLAKFFEQASGGASITDAYFGFIIMFTALVTTGFTVASVLRLRSEEADLRAEPVLATPLSRIRWSLTWLAVTVLGSALVLAAAGLACGLVWSVLGGEVSDIGMLTLASLSYLPAVLTLGGLAFAVFGWFPRAASGVAWGAMAGVVVAGWLGDLLSLPQWAMDLSPFNHVPMVPAVDPDLVPLVTLGAVVLALLAAGLTGFRRRDLASG